MKIFQIIIALFVFLFIVSGCEKDDTNPNNLDENSIIFNGENYKVSGYLISLNDNKYENALKVVIRGSYSNENEKDSTSLVEQIGGETFYVNFILIPFDSSSIEGTYFSGDLNGDGIVDQYDASDVGYCTSASLEMGESFSFKRGELTINETTFNGTNYDKNGLPLERGEINGFNIQFSLKNTEDLIFAGNINLVDNRN